MTPAKSPAERLRELVDLLDTMRLRHVAGSVRVIATDIEAREKALRDALEHARSHHRLGDLRCPTCEAGRKLVEG